MSTNLPDPAISVSNLCKTFRSGMLRPRVTKALDDISFTVRPGEIFGILGPNGAGKTTLLNILMGLLVPDGGEIEVLGQQVTRRFRLPLKQRMNMCSGNPNFPWCMTVTENMNFYRLLYNVPKEKYLHKREELFAALELTENRYTRYDELSTGNKQRLALAKALINDPEVLLLDEPTIGLDPDISIKIRKYIKQIQAEKKKTILLTTHYMKEAEEMCDRIAFIKAGRITALGTRQELLKQTNTQNFEEAFLALAHE